MKNILLNNKLVLLIILVCTLSCKKEPCINIEELDELAKETKEWYTDENIVNQNITDQNGVSQTLKVSNAHSRESDFSYSDNCGNDYGSFSFSIQYQTSISPLNFSVDVRGDGNPNSGFHLELFIYDKNGNSINRTTYDFKTKTCRESNATVEILNQYIINSTTYNGVMKITFNSANSNEVKTVFYAKQFGVIKFIKGNGNEFQID